MVLPFKSLGKPPPNQPETFFATKTYVSPRYLRTMRTANPYHPHLPYAIKDLSYQGVLFGRLQQDIQIQPLLMQNNQYMYELQPSLMRKWYDLENALTAITGMLLTATKADTFALDFDSGTLPKDCGYLRAHKSAEIARVAALKSRDAFHNLAAFASWAFFRCGMLSSWKHKEKMDVEITPYNRGTHALTIYLKQKLHWLSDRENACFIDHFMGSDICSLTAPRVGCVIPAYPPLDYFTENTATFATHLAVEGMPLFIDFGDVRHSLDRPTLDLVNRYKPDLRLLIPLYRAKLPSHLALSLHDEEPPYDEDPPFDDPPPYGVTAFFDEREKENQAKPLNRIEQSKLARRNELAARLVILDSSKLYVWQYVGKFLCRTQKPLLHKARRTIWKRFTRSQGKYDPYRDEWDFAYDFGLTQDQPEYEAPGYGDQEGEHHEILLPSEGEAALEVDTNSGPIVLHDSTEDLCQAFSNIVHDSLPAAPCPDPSPSIFAAMDLLRFRFSFNIDFPPSTEPHDYGKILKYIGYVNSFNPKLHPGLPKPSISPSTETHIPESYRANVEIFIEAVTLNIRNPYRLTSSVPVPGPHNPPIREYVFPGPQSNVIVEYSLVLHEIPIIFADEDPGKRFVQNSKTEQFYVFNLQLPHQPTVFDDIRLAVRSALTVQQVRRQDFGPDLPSIVRTMVNHGIPFQLLKPSATKPDLSPAIPHRLSRYRKEPFKPIWLDYADYAATRDDFLRGPRGHLALMEGGLLWRLAINVVNADSVFQDLGGYDYFYRCHDIDHYFCGERLTVSEIELLIGSYHIFNQGMSYTSLRLGHSSYCFPKDGTKYYGASWWPKPSAWNGSCFDIGCWSPRAETWYQERLRRYTGSEQTLVKHSAWKSSHLRAFKDTPKLINAAELWALEEVLTPT